ncbi:MAG: Ig-like domain-containing protein [Clostridiales bacterium]|nr:Ig-like domain-containing protein [Clostridiales bacterium]
MKAAKKLISVFLSAVLVLSLCFILMPDSAKAANEGVVVSVTTDKTELQRGDTVTISVNLSGNTSATGMTLYFYYDTEKLSLVEKANADDYYGDIFNDLGRSDICDVYPDTTKGCVSAVLAKTSGIISNGNVFTLQFTVKDNASGSAVTSIKSEFCDANLGDVSATVNNAAASLKIIIPTTAISLQQTSLELTKGGTSTLNAVLTPTDSTDTVVWTSSNTAVAQVDNTGLVSAIGKGTAKITATAGAYSATCDVTVTVPLESISITGGATTIKKGTSTQLSVEYNPDDTTDDKTVQWSSNNASVASVNSSGLVTAIADGTAVITATVGSKTAEYTITVQEVKLTSVDIEDTATIHKGESEALTLTYTPANTTDDKTATWQSSDETIAKVDGGGTVTAVAPGSATITVKVGNFTDTCLVTVDAPLKSILPAETSVDLVKNQTYTIYHTVDPADTTDSTAVTYESSDSSVVSVSADGLLTALKAGSATITLKGANQVTAAVSVTVTEIPIDTVTLNTRNITIEAGESESLTAIIGPADNTDNNQTIAWSSSDDSVVKVEADPADSTKATITALQASQDTVTITATAANGTKAECKVKVPVHISSIYIEDTTIRRGKTTILDLTVTPSYVDDDTTVTWVSSDPDVATVDADTGMITALKAGSTKITVQTVNSKDSVTLQPYTAVATVSVVEQSLTEEIASKLSFSDMQDALLKGQSIDMNSLLNLSALISTYGITDDINMVWSVDGESVAAIDQTGTLIGLGEGKAAVSVKITATDGSGSAQVYTVKTEVSVEEIPLASIAFDKVITEMQTGATTTLHIIYNPENTTDATDAVWASSDESVLAVMDGTLTAVKAGTAAITATVGNLQIACTIEVKDPVVTTDDPADVTTPDNGSSGTTSATTANTATTEAASTDTSVTGTGDTNSFMIFVILLICAMGGIVVICVKAKKAK